MQNEEKQLQQDRMFRFVRRFANQVPRNDSGSTGATAATASTKTTKTAAEAAPSSFKDRVRGYFARIVPPERRDTLFKICVSTSVLSAFARSIYQASAVVRGRHCVYVCVCACGNIKCDVKPNNNLMRTRTRSRARHAKQNDQHADNVARLDRQIAWLQAQADDERQRNERTYAAFSKQLDELGDFTVDDVSVVVFCSFCFKPMSLHSWRRKT